MYLEKTPTQGLVTKDESDFEDYDNEDDEGCESSCDEEQDDTFKKGNADLMRYKDVFNNLTDRFEFHAGVGFAVIEVVITYDAKSAIAICRNESLEDDKDEFTIRSFSLTTQDDEWTLSIPGEFLKMCDIVQSDNAEMIAIAYNDDGQFTVKVISRKPDNYGKVISDISINQTFGLNRGSKPIHGIYNPLITSCFLPNDLLFVAAFHRKE